MRDSVILIIIYMAVVALILISMVVVVCLLANSWAQAGLCACGLLLGGLGLGSLIRRWLKLRRMQKAQVSELAETLTPQLMGEYSPYVLEAAQQLGEARDVTAVPALILALEHCMETQRPGWRDRAAALADALGKIGDRRALPLLYRLDNVRGIGLIPAVRNAIAAIEPQTSLLRAGSVHDVPPQSLLRSVTQLPETDEAPILLRSAERVES